MARTESGRMMTKDIENMTIAEYIEVKVNLQNTQIKAPSSRTSEILGVSFITEDEEEDNSETLPCQLPPKEMNLGSFTLLCTIVEMANMTKKAPLGIVENIKVKIDKFLFHYDFLVIDMLEGPNEIMLLGRPFLATIHAQIDVFRREISLGIGEEKVKFDMNGGICHSRVPFEKIYMASSIQESEYFNPLEIENDDSPTCLLLEQSTPPCSNESIDTVDSSDDMQELEGRQEDEVESHLLENVVSRWHVYKPVHVTFEDYEKDCRKWPTCNPDLSFCSGYDAIYGKEESGMLKQWICFRNHERKNVRENGMIFADFLKVRYGKKNIDDESDSPPNYTLRINTYFPEFFQTQLKKLLLRDDSFEEWVKSKLGHTTISEAIKCDMFKEWIKENFNFEVDFEKTHDDPYSRMFNVDKEEFDKEMEQLVNEYELKAGRKRYALEEVWDKCEKFHDTTKLWYDKGFEEEELWQNGIKGYTPPLVKSETFEVHRYTFKNRRSFISITKQEGDVLSLGRGNMPRFMVKIRKEMDEEGETTRKT
ncbi:phospholipase-like protein [Tanacetum coccineum]